MTAGFVGFLLNPSHWQQKETNPKRKLRQINSFNYKKRKKRNPIEEEHFAKYNKFLLNFICADRKSKINNFKVTIKFLYNKYIKNPKIPKIYSAVCLLTRSCNIVLKSAHTL